MSPFRPLLAVLFLIALAARAETTLGTAITALPYHITKAGVYHLTKNLSYAATSGAAIEIEATDVIIDLNAHEILGTAGSSAVSTGVYCNNLNRVTIKNGTIRGFQVGVNLTSDDAVISDLLVTNNFEVGITVTGNNIKIADNRVCDTGGNATYTYAIGISLTGTYATITGNDVQDTFASDNTGHYGNGIRIKNCSNVLLSGNHLLDIEPAAPQKATSTGVEIIASDTLIFLGNIVTTTQLGFDLAPATSGKYGDNTTVNVTNDYNATGSGMTDIGNNN